MTPEPLKYLSCWWAWYTALWQPVPQPFHLAPDAIHVWRTSLTDWNDISTQDLRPFLSEPEQEREARISNPQRRQQFLVSHALTRALAARYFRCPLTMLSITRDQNTCLAISRQPARSLFVGISHSEDAIVVTFSAHASGVDVERKRHASAYPHVARRLLPPLQGALKGPPPITRQNSGIEFTRYWTALEAFYKFQGQGAVRDMLRPDRAIQTQKAVPVSACHFSVYPDYIGALVASPAARQHCFFIADPSLLHYFETAPHEAFSLPRKR